MAAGGKPGRFGWTLIQIKRQRREIVLNQKNTHKFKKKSKNYNSGEELPFCHFFWTGLNSIQTCGQKFQTLVQNMGND